MVWFKLTQVQIYRLLIKLYSIGIVSAPLWSSEDQKFAGMLTVADFINLIQYYYTHSSVEDAFREIESFELAHLRNVEKLVGAPAPQLVSMDPMATLYDACRMLAESRVHRVPLLDIEPETGTKMIVSVITQYRILKFIASNVSLFLCICVMREEMAFTDIVYRLPVQTYKGFTSTFI